MGKRPREHEPDWDTGLDPQDLQELDAAPLVFDRASLRAIDDRSERDFGLSPLVLMENAGRHAADLALQMLDEMGGGEVLVVCGCGNNGGDGLVAARHIHNAGARVRVVVCGSEDKLPPAASANLRTVRAMGLAPTPMTAEDAGTRLRAFADEGGGPSVVVDALLGTGLAAAVRAREAGIIAAINGMRKGGSRVLSVDLPSGLDADLGTSLGATVSADLTVSFVGWKKGFGALEAQGYIGEVVVADIGAPRELVEKLGRPAAIAHPDAPEGGARRGDRSGRGRRRGSEPA